MIIRQLPQQIEQYITTHKLFAGYSTLLVGVSGGTDSVCLLHLLLSLREKLGLDLHVAHLNHQLRGTESDADAAYVADLARRLGISFDVGYRDVKAHQTEKQCSLEEAARDMRYSFFAEIAQKVGAGGVAVAHTADDQAETILLHLIRGTGLAGLRGMRPVSRLNLPKSVSLEVVRPLLEISRKDTEAYCAQNELFPRHDSSNDSMEHLRNQIRAEIMPKLIGYNPNIVESITRLGRIVEDNLNYLDVRMDEVFESTVETIPHGVSLDNSVFNSLTLALRRHLLRTVLGQVLGSLKNIEMVHIENIMDAMEQPAGKELSLPHGLTFYGDYERSFLSRSDNPLLILPPIEGEKHLAIPGETRVSGWKVTSEVFLNKPADISEGGFVAFLDLDMTGSDMIVRGRKEGDRFQPLGMDDSKKLQDFMVDSKIPRAWRDRIPLICSAGRIIWVAGWRIDDRVKVTDSTQRILKIEFEME